MRDINVHAIFRTTAPTQPPSSLEPKLEDSWASIYFAIVAAVPGITGAIGITVGGFVATVTDFGGLPTVFPLSAVLRVFALLPLMFVHEQRSVPLGQLMRVLFPLQQPTPAD